MKKSKERLDAEASMTMTWQQKLGNFWFYYRWAVICSVLGVVLVATFAYDIMTQVDPDYQIALLTPDYISDGTRQQLEQTMSAYADDTNGDGKVVVTVMHYQTSIGEHVASDPAVQMAAVTRLAADMQSVESVLYMTNYTEEYQDFYGVFAYNDGTVPVEGEEPELERMGVPISDCPAFEEFLAMERVEPFEGYKLLKRVVTPNQMEKADTANRVNAANTLFDQLASAG